LTVRRLSIQRYGVVHRRRDADIVQSLLQSCTIVDEHGVLREHAGTIETLLDAIDAVFIHQRVVLAAQIDSSFDLPIESFELRKHDGALKRIHPAADAHSRVHIATALAMNANLA